MSPLTKTLLLCATLPLANCAGVLMMAAGAANNADINAEDISHLRMTFPATLLVTHSNGPDITYQGTLTGSVSGNSHISLTGTGQTTCTGLINDTGDGAINCSDGHSYPFTKDKDGLRMSGINTFEFQRGDTTVRGALGWGNHNDTADLYENLSQN